MGKTVGEKIAADLLRVVDGWPEMERRDLPGIPHNLMFIPIPHMKMTAAELIDAMRASAAAEIDAYLDREQFEREICEHEHSE